MPQPLRVLLVEDNPHDAELVVRSLRRAGFEPTWERVDTEAAYVEKLRGPLDLVISDYAMPQFNGLRALELLRQRPVEIPFILVSATIGEETAVQAIKQGATDYLLKDRLTRLGPAVEHALGEFRLREEKRKAALVLVENERFIKATLDSLTARIAILDEQGVILAVNEAWRAFAGNDGMPGERAEVGENYLRVCAGALGASGAEARRVAESIWAVLDGGATPPEVEYPYHSPTERRWFVARVTPFPGAGPRRAVVAYENITARKLAEASVIASERHYRLLFEGNPQPMWVFDRLTLRFLAVNAAAVEHYGYSRDEFLAMTIKEIRSPEGVKELEEALRAETVTESGWRAAQHVRKDGTLLDVEISFNDLEFASRAARLVMANDVTARKRAESALRESEERFRGLIENATDLIAVVDETGRVEFQSPSVRRLLGYAPAEVIGRSVTEFIHPEDVGTATGGIARALAQLPAKAVEYRIRHQNGSWRIFQSIGSLMPDPSGRKLIVVNSRDITETREFEAQFLRAQRLEAIGTLSSGIAHDLNNILAPTLMVVPMLKEKLSEPRDRELLAMIEQGARRGANIIKQLLTFSRGIEGERGVLQPRHLLKEMASIMRETFPRELKIVERSASGLWAITADATQIHQVLMNLCVNARDAMPQGGSLTLNGENVVLKEDDRSMHPSAMPGGYVRLMISDTGQGIARENLDRIFEPFFTTKEIGKGTGLGLSTVLGIVKSHGGFVTVYSEVGRGTSFNIYLPAAPGAVETGVAPASQAYDGRRNLILVVDDELGIRRAMSLLLEQHNYRVLTAADGREALEIFRTSKEAIQLVLTDVMMPVMNGVTLIRTLRELEPTLRMIAASGLHDQDRREELAAIGVDTVLVKPCSPEDILGALQRALATD